MTATFGIFEGVACLSLDSVDHQYHRDSQTEAIPYDELEAHPTPKHTIGQLEEVSDYPYILTKTSNCHVTSPSKESRM